jgi:hypothetical protein
MSENYSDQNLRGRSFKGQNLEGDVWSFEPDEKDDSMDDYEFLTTAEVESKIEVPVTCCAFDNLYFIARIMWCLQRCRCNKDYPYCLIIRKSIYSRCIKQA